MALEARNYSPALMYGASLTFTFDDVTTTDDLTVGDDLTVTGAATVGETLTVTGATTFTGIANAVAAGVQTFQAVTNVHDTAPTQAEMVTAFGTVPGRGFIGTIDDNNGDTISYICWSTDASYFYIIGTKGG